MGERSFHQQLKSLITLLESVDSISSADSNEKHLRQLSDFQKI